MKKIKYNKLVRDKIPEIIKAAKKEASTSVANEAMYREKLYEKLKEEVNEFLESEAPEEIADILEVLYAIMELNSLSKNEIEIIRTDKADKRGSFNKRLILHSVTNHHED